MHIYLPARFGVERDFLGDVFAQSFCDIEVHIADFVVGRNALGVYGDDDALRAEEVGRLGDQRGVGDRSGVERCLVRARLKHTAHIGDIPQTAAYRKRYEDLLGHLLDHIHDNVAVVGACGDVEEHKLIRALLVVEAREVGGVAGVPYVHEAHALDHSALVYVEARDYALS